MQGVYTDVTKMKKRKIEYNALANYINSEDEEHLQFLKGETIISRILTFYYFSIIWTNPMSGT